MMVYTSYLKDHLFYLLLLNLGDCGIFFNLSVELKM